MALFLSCIILPFFIFFSVSHPGQLKEPRTTVRTIDLNRESALADWKARHLMQQRAWFTSFFLEGGKGMFAPRPVFFVCCPFFLDCCLLMATWVMGNTGLLHDQRVVCAGSDHLTSTIHTPVDCFHLSLSQSAYVFRCALFSSDPMHVNTHAQIPRPRPCPPF